MTVNLLGIDIDNISFDEAIDRIIAFAASDGHHHIVTPNVDHLMKLQQDSEFREIYLKASLSLPDLTSKSIQGHRRMIT